MEGLRFHTEEFNKLVLIYHKADWVSYDGNKFNDKSLAGLSCRYVIKEAGRIKDD